MFDWFTALFALSMASFGIQLLIDPARFNLTAPNPQLLRRRKILEQLSDRLSRKNVPGVGEPRRGVVAGNRLDGEANCFLERLLRARAQAAQDGFDLRERLLNGREVRRIGRQEEQLAAARFNGKANTVGFVGAQIVQHDDLSRSQRRRELLGDIPFKRRSIHCPLDQPGLVHTVGSERGDQREVLAVVARDRSSGPPIMRRPAIHAGQRDIRAAFVDKDELLRVEVSRGRPPGAARLLVAFAGCQCLFLCVQPKRRMARHIVASLSDWPWCSAHQAQCSSTVASGAASNRARRLDSWSGPIRRGQPGMRLRSSEPVSRRCTTARFTVLTAT